MFRRTLTSALAVYCLLTVTVNAKDVSEVMPGDTLGYVVINHIGDTDRKIQALAQRMKLPIPSLLSMVKTQSGITEGIDQTGSISLAFFSTPPGPTAILYIPVDNYAAFIEQLEPEENEDKITAGELMGRPVIVGHKSGHAVIAWPSDRTLLQKVLSDDEGQGASELVKAINSRDHDIAAVLPADGVQLLVALGQQGLEQLKEIVRAQSDDDLVLMGIEFYVHFLNGVGSEVTAVAAGLQLDEGGTLRANKWVWVQPEGKIASILRDVEPNQDDLIAGLPNIPYVVAFGGVMPSEVVKPMMDFSRDIMKTMPQMYGLTPEQVDKMMDLSVEYLSDLRGMSLILGVGGDGPPLYREMLGAFRVGDAEDYLTKYREYWAKLDDVIGESEGSFLKDVKLQDLEIDGMSVLEVDMPMPLGGLQLPNREEVEALMDKLYGSGGVKMYLTAADDDTVLMAYTDTAILQKAMADTSQQLSQRPDLVSTSKLLPDGAHMVGFWSPSGTMTFANRALQLMAEPEKRIQLPAFPKTPPVGWAMTAKTSVVEYNLVVPAEILEAAGGFAESVKQLGDRPSGE